MAVEIDHKIAKKYFPEWAREIELKMGRDVKRVALLSPDAEQHTLHEQIFPHAQIRVFGIGNWDLNSGPSNELFDVVSAASVFMASPDPEKWLDHVSRCCSYFWLQDHILRFRDGANNRECGIETGDVMRFSYGEHRARISWAYDLGKLGDRVEKFVAYDPGDAPKPDKPNKSFIAQITGYVPFVFSHAFLVLSDALEIGLLIV